MARPIHPVRIGPVEITPEELEALQIRRDYKRLREAAGWGSGTSNKEAAILKDLLGDDPASGKRNERTARQRRVSQSPFTKYGY